MSVTEQLAGTGAQPLPVPAPAPAATGTARRPRRRAGKSVGLTVVMTIMLLYAVLPLFWLLVNSTKTQASLFSTFGLWFGGHFELWHNITQTLTYNHEIFLRWLGNTALYVVAGAGSATLMATMAGYGLAKFDFPGRRLLLAVVLGAAAIPSTAIALPTFLMFSKLGLTNTPWSIILPSMVSPLGLYLIWIYASEAIPDELLEAARMDGASEFRTFFTISFGLLRPGIVTVLLFTVVATWNNYFLPLIMLSDPKWYPLTVGLSQWNAQSWTAGGQTIYNLVITGSLLAIVPIVVAFFYMQRHWQSGLAAGSVKQ